MKEQSPSRRAQREEKANPGSAVFEYGGGGVVEKKKNQMEKKWEFWLLRFVLDISTGSCFLSGSEQEQQQQQHRSISGGIHQHFKEAVLILDTQPKAFVNET